MAETIYVIAPGSAIRKRTRLAKMIPVFLSEGHRVNFIGWERLKGEREQFAWGDERVSEESILKGGGYVSKTARAMYPLWMLAVFFKVLFLGRSRLLFCLGWETAFPALLASFLTGSRIVFDDADRFSMIIRLPGPAHRLLTSLERWTSYRVLAHLVPGFTRYEWQHPKMMLLRNTPTTQDFARARELGRERVEGEFVLYVNGWIGETRGASVFLELMKRLRERRPGVRMIAAGWTDCDAGRELFAMSNVTFYGELPPDEALALYYVSDVVLTYYDPAVPINRKAESNKWGDCIFLGKPFIANSEVETARVLLDNGFGFGVAYNDVDGLVGLVEELASASVAEVVESSGREQIRAEYLPFDVVIRRILSFVEKGRGLD